jgi:hypothetical protein
VFPLTLCVFLAVEEIEAGHIPFGMPSLS